MKIVEAFAAGLPVVSTPIGCEGLDVVDGRHLLIALRDQFVDRIAWILSDPVGAERLAIAARRMARERYDWVAIGEAAAAAIAPLAPTARTTLPRAANAY